MLPPPPPHWSSALLSHGIFLDFEAGELSFYNVNDVVLYLHTYSACAFPWPLGAPSSALGPLKSGQMVISTVTLWAGQGREAGGASWATLLSEGEAVPRQWGGPTCPAYRE